MVSHRGSQEDNPSKHKFHEEAEIGPCEILMGVPELSSGNAGSPGVSSCSFRASACRVTRATTFTNSVCVATRISNYAAHSLHSIYGLSYESRSTDGFLDPPGSGPPPGPPGTGGGDEPQIVSGGGLRLKAQFAAISPSG